MKRGTPSAVLALFWLCALVPCGVADTFSRGGDRFATGPRPCAVVAVDLDGRGALELVTADRGMLASPQEERPANWQVSLLHAEDGLEYRRDTLNTGYAPYGIVAANLDERKALDLLVCSFHAMGDQNLTLFRNLWMPPGSGTGEVPRSLASALVPVYFTVPANRFQYARARDADGNPIFAVPGMTSVAVADVDHDGLRDALATGWSSDVILHFPGDPEAYLRQPRVYACPGGPRSLALGDFNGDGETDFAVTLYSQNEVAVWQGDGEGRFSEVDRFPSRGPLPHRVRVADFNGDGQQDLAVSHCHASDSIVLFFGDGDMRFALSQELMLGERRDTLECEIRDMAVEDLNGDRLVDIAAACYSSSEVVVLLNDAEGEAPGFPLRFRRERYSFPKDSRPRALCAADLDGDGDCDLAVAVWGQPSDGVRLLLGR